MSCSSNCQECVATFKTSLVSVVTPSVSSGSTVYCDSGCHSSLLKSIQDPTTSSPSTDVFISSIEHMMSVLNIQTRTTENMNQTLNRVMGFASTTVPPHNPFVSVQPPKPLNIYEKKRRPATPLPVLQKEHQRESEHQREQEKQQQQQHYQLRQQPSEEKQNFSRSYPHPHPSLSRSYSDPLSSKDKTNLFTSHLVKFMNTNRTKEHRCVRSKTHKGTHRDTCDVSSCYCVVKCTCVCSCGCETTGYGVSNLFPPCCVSKDDGKEYIGTGSNTILSQSSLTILESMKQSHQDSNQIEVNTTPCTPTESTPSPALVYASPSRSTSTSTTTSTSTSKSIPFPSSFPVPIPAPAPNPVYAPNQVCMMYPKPDIWRLDIERESSLLKIISGTPVYYKFFIEEYNRLFFIPLIGFYMYRTEQYDFRLLSYSEKKEVLKHHLYCEKLSYVKALRTSLHHPVDFTDAKVEQCARASVYSPQEEETLFSKIIHAPVLYHPLNFTIADRSKMNDRYASNFHLHPATIYLTLIPYLTCKYTREVEYFKKLHHLYQTYHNKKILDREIDLNRMKENIYLVEYINHWLNHKILPYTHIYSILPVFCAPTPNI